MWRCHQFLARRRCQRLGESLGVYRFEGTSLTILIVYFVTAGHFFVLSSCFIPLNRRRGGVLPREKMIKKKKRMPVGGVHVKLPYTCRGSASNAIHLSIISANPLITTGISVSFQLRVWPIAVMSEVRGRGIQRLPPPRQCYCVG